MHGGRGINLPKAETKKYFTDKKQWQRAVDDINSSKYDDNSDYIGVTGRSTVEINGREWARWSDAQQKGYIELSSMSEQGVAEGWFDRDYQKFDQEKHRSKTFSKGFLKNVSKLLQSNNSSKIAHSYLMFNNGKDPNPKDMREEYTWTDHTILRDWLLEAFDEIEKRYPDKDVYDPSLAPEVYEIVGKKMHRAILAQIKEEQGVAEGNYDRDDYYNARQGREYGKDLTATGYGGDGSGTRRDDIFKGQSKNLPADPFQRTSGSVPRAAQGQQHRIALPGEVDEGEKVGNMDADAFDAAMARLKKLAGSGPMKTVYDPAKRVYRNVPTAVQPKK
jgi:hypothetical protein